MRYLSRMYNKGYEGLIRVVDELLPRIGLARKSELDRANTQLDQSRSLRRLFQSVVYTVMDGLGLDPLKWPYNKSTKTAFEEDIARLIGLYTSQPQLMEGLQRVLGEKVYGALIKNPRVLRELLEYDSDSNRVIVTAKGLESAPCSRQLARRIRKTVLGLRGSNETLETQVFHYEKALESGGKAIEGYKAELEAREGGKGYKVTVREAAEPREIKTRVITDESLQSRVEQLERLVAWYKSNFGEQEDILAGRYPPREYREGADSKEIIRLLEADLRAARNLIGAYRKNTGELEKEMGSLRGQVEEQLRRLREIEIDGKTIDKLDEMGRDDRRNYLRELETSRQRLIVGQQVMEETRASMEERASAYDTRRTELDQLANEMVDDLGALQRAVAEGDPILSKQSERIENLNRRVQSLIDERDALDKDKNNLERAQQKLEAQVQQQAGEAQRIRGVFQTIEVRIQRRYKDPTFRIGL